MTSATADGAVDSGPSDAGRNGAAPVAPFRPQRRVSTTGTIVKIVSLGLLNGLVIWALPRMFDKPDYAMAIAAILATLAIDIVYLSPRRLIPYKYLLPGTLFLLAFAVYPILNTVYLSTTNYGTGNLGTKDDAIATIERNSIGASDESPRYELQVLAEGDASGPIAYLLTDAEGNVFLGTADGLTPVAEDELIEDGRRQTIAGYEALNLGAVQDRAADIDAFVVPTDQGDIVNQGFTEALIEIQRRTYDPELDAIVDVDGPVYEAADGYFISEEGQRLSPGWRYSVGLGNYVDLFTDPRFYEPMARVLAWTMFFAVASVVTTFAVGLLLAMVFNAPMKGKRLYRGLIVIPYAIPSFMTALVWRGMFNRQFGVINEWLGVNLNWLGGQWLPYLTILIVNLWLGYPYMFLVVYRRSPGHSQRLRRSRQGRRSHRVQGVSQDHVPAAADRRRPAADRQLRLQLQQLQSDLPAHRGTSTGARLRRRDEPTSSSPTPTSSPSSGHGARTSGSPRRFRSSCSCSSPASRRIGFRFTKAFEEVR